MLLQCRYTFFILNSEITTSDYQKFPLFETGPALIISDSQGSTELRLIIFLFPQLWLGLFCESDLIVCIETLWVWVILIFAECFCLLFLSYCSNWLIVALWMNLLLWLIYKFFNIVLHFYTYCAICIVYIYYICCSFSMLSICFHLFLFTIQLFTCPIFSNYFMNLI